MPKAKAKSTSKTIRVSLPRTELRLKLALKQMGREYMERNEYEGVEEDTTTVDYYIDNFLEDMSIAGFTEARDFGRGSACDFADLIRVHAEDLAWVKELLGYEPYDLEKGDCADEGDYHLSVTLIDALSRNRTLAPALPLLKPFTDEKPTGWLHPEKREFDLYASLEESLANSAKTSLVGQSVSKYLQTMAMLHSRDKAPGSEMEAAAIKLAGLFRMSEDGVNRVVKELVEAGLKHEMGLKLALAHIVLTTVRGTPRFYSALRAVQPK